MKAISDKSHLIISCTLRKKCPWLFSRSGREPTTTMIDGLSIEPNKTELLLDIKIAKESKFDEHVNYLCKKQVRSSMLLPVLHFS